MTHKEKQKFHYDKQYYHSGSNVLFSKPDNLWQWGKFYPVLTLEPFFSTISKKEILINCCGMVRELPLLNKYEIRVTATDLMIDQLMDYKKAGILSDISLQDAENLTYKDNSFDYTYINAGLHHLEYPHKGLAELFRVAREAAIFIEAQDSFLHGLSRVFGRKKADFEPAGNYVYRWKTREIEKFALSAHAHSYAVKTIFLPLRIYMRQITGYQMTFFKRIFAVLNVFLRKFGNVMIVFIFKSPPSTEQLNLLKNQNFKYKKL